MVNYGNWVMIYNYGEGIDLRSDTVDLPNPVLCLEVSQQSTLRVTTQDNRVLTKVWYMGYNEIPVTRVHLTGSTLSAETIVIGWY